MTQFPFPVSANDSHTGSIVTEMDKYLIRKRKSDIDSDDDHDGECEVCEDTTESKEDSDLKSTGKWKSKYAENRRKGHSEP